MADLITGEAFGQLFRTFEHSARRLETLDRYRDPEEDDAFARYLAGSPENPSYVASGTNRQLMPGLLGPRARHASLRPRTASPITTRL